MTTQGLEFPCEYPIKVMGRQSDEFRARMLAVLEARAAIVADGISERPSRDGTYLSLTCIVQVESREHLDTIYRELHATGLVLFAL
jgi:putative lipoic acid-binding regulatory protein